MKKIAFILCFLWSVLPIVAQEEDVPISAGTDFYFTILPHWLWTRYATSDNKLIISINAIEEADVTIESQYGYMYQDHIAANTSKDVELFTDFDFLSTPGMINCLEGLHVTCTAPCYVNAWVVASEGSAASAILPKHLLGTQYMLHGIPGGSANAVSWIYEGSAYSMFSIVGTADNTHVSITPRVNMYAYTGSSIFPYNSEIDQIHTNETVTYTLSENEVLLFKPFGPLNDISGTLVEADSVIAVFQGNELTRYPAQEEATTKDYVWEQARPTDSWGKEFIIASSTQVAENYYYITAIEDSTEVEFHTANMVYRRRTLQRGESVSGGENISGQSGVFVFEYVTTNKPVVCNLYTTSSALNNGIGDPSMVEIIPVDNMASEARWYLAANSNHSHNTPYTASLIVITEDGNEGNITFNGQALNSYYTQNGGHCDRGFGYVGYEFSVPPTSRGRLVASNGGFSAYVLLTGKRAEAASMNISLPYNRCPEIEIVAPDSVCIDTRNILRAEFINPGPFIEPLQFQWYFSEDSLNWTPLDGETNRELKLKAKPKHSGWYQVSVQDSRTFHPEECYNLSEPHKFFVIEDCPPILCPEGILIFREEYDSPVGSVDTTISDLCGNSDLSLIVNLPAGHAETRLMLRLYDPATGNELMAYDTGDIPPDSLQVGTSFTIMENVSSLRWTISNNAAGAAGTPFAMDNIEIRLCMEPISIGGGSPACRKKPHTLRGIYENWGTLDSPEFMWTYSADSLTWTELQRGENKNYTIPVVHRSHEGWYKVTVANAGNLDMVNCREESEPFKLETMYCNTAVDQYIDTTACDTLLEYDLHWRGHQWPEIGTVVDTIKDFEDDDSVYVHLTLHTKICCPDIERIRIDSAVCDTLMPFMWFFKDTMLLFDVPAAKEIEYQHPRWENCIGTIYTLTLDTFHCERLYLLIHNKYNWQLVCNNVELTRLFPELTPLEFQWFKDSMEIEGANSDDYSEEHELHGYYQLRIKLNEVVDNDDEYIWSNILDIHDTPEPAPVTKRIYNSSGMLIGEDRLMRGVFLILYQQGDKFWTEKKIVP